MQLVQYNHRPLSKIGLHIITFRLRITRPMYLFCCIILKATVPGLLQRGHAITEHLLGTPEDIPGEEVGAVKGPPQKILLHSKLRLPHLGW